MVNNRFNQPVYRDPTKPIGFQDTNKEVLATRGVKLKSKSQEKAEQEKIQREEYARKFEERADQTVKYHADVNSNTLNIIAQFMKVSEDKTLPHNRGSIGEDVEKEIRQKVIQLALDLNNDENEPNNGYGSVVVLSAVCKILLMQRDRINILEYELEMIKRDLLKLKTSSTPNSGA